MSKALLILTIFAIVLTPNVLSAESDRELAGINLGNLGSAIGGLVGAIKNQTSTTTPATNTSTSTPATNNSSTPATNTTTSAPTTNTTSYPVKNNTSSNNNSSTTPATNTTTSTPAANNTSSTPATNTTTSVPATNNTSSTPATNTTTSAPATNNTSSYPPVNNNTSTAPVEPVSDSDDSDTETSDSDAPSTNPTSPTNTTTSTPAAPIKYAKNDVNMATFKDDCMRVHNEQRLKVGLGNLTWSDSLAASAQAWANDMAKNGFRHSGKTGENIASTSYSTSTLGRLLGLWVHEQDHYIVGCKYPKCSTTSAEVGHYTQMVWHSTTQVGCGFAPGANRGYNYLCCQYYKAGNIVGQYVY